MTSRDYTNSINSIDSTINKYVIGSIESYNYNKYVQTKPTSTRVKSFYSQFRPVDNIIRLIVEKSHLIMKHLNYKSDVIGFIALISFITGIYFMYNKKTNLTHLFIFFSFCISYFDKLYSTKLNDKQKSKEMLIVLIKLTANIIINMILQFYTNRNSSCNIINNSLYMLFFYLLFIIMLCYHTEKFLYTKKIKSKKILYIKKLNTVLLFITTGVLIHFSYKIISKQAEKDPFSIFILNEK